MLKESDSGAEVISLESGEFIFVGGDAANCSQNTGRTMDMTGLNQEEVSVVRKIKNLVTENEALKGVLIKHNELIQEYCNELEQLQKNQNIDKESTQATIEGLKKDNEQLKISVASSMSWMGANQPSISGPMSFQQLQHLMPMLDDILKKLKGIKPKSEPTLAEKSLPYPVQESQSAIDCIEHFSQSFEKLKVSYNDHALPEEFVSDGLTQQIRDKDSLINDLKSDLSERMNDTEQLMQLQERFNEMQNDSMKLNSNTEKLKKVVQQQKMKIEQLECEQPSVEIMQIASPQQTKRIETLNAELQRASLEIKKLLDEKVSFEKDLKAQMSRDASLQSKADSIEINEIRNSYEIAMKGLKEEIAAEKKKTYEFEGQMKNEALLGKPLANEEISTLKKTIDMLRKRENRDLDKMDALTVERDELKKTLETQQRVIQDANPRMHQKTESTYLQQEQFQMVSHDESAYAHEKTMNTLQKEVVSHKETIGILREENTTLKQSLVTTIHNCNNCEHMEGKIDRLVQENESLFERFKDFSSMERRLKEEHARCEQFAADKYGLEDEVEHLKMESEGRSLQHREESESISQLKQQIVKYESDTIQYRQRNNDLETSQNKIRGEFDRMWKTLQANTKQISKVEEEKNNLSVKANKMEGLLKAQMDDKSKLENCLRAKDVDIKKLKDEVETTFILREQVRVYESDFNIEREAREKQHSDNLILREEAHHLKLENNRLREEVETAYKQQMAELQGRYGVGSHVTGRAGNYQNLPTLYGRGPTMRDDRWNTENVRSNTSYGINSEVTAQEPEQAVQRSCPKCHAPFPDLDTLQIHVLECLDE